MVSGLCVVRWTVTHTGPRQPHLGSKAGQHTDSTAGARFFGLLCHECPEGDLLMTRRSTWLEPSGHAHSFPKWRATCANFDVAWPFFRILSSQHMSLRVWCSVERFAKKWWLVFVWKETSSKTKLKDGSRAHTNVFYVYEEEDFRYFWWKGGTGGWMDKQNERVRRGETAQRLFAWNVVLDHACIT